jgi:hypothetical protein
MLTHEAHPTECRCVIQYGGDWFSPTEVAGKVCDVHAELELSIADVHAFYVALTRERMRFNVEVNKLADNTPEMKETLIRTPNGFLREADVEDAQAYPEKDFPRVEAIKPEYLTTTTLKEDGSFDVRLQESDKKAELEAALSK